ncbi:hypothetical protein [Jatrophihabitans endophyticus]|uniref:hypothetical protein n=1 Tax=Jatrophihabitans endophyticus TaxID=1206085 RepID=UPI001F3F9846|nr:hypothetical protein [Jatrophihabitans endophyticus]
MFADLEAQAGALAQAERAAEVDERTRAEVGRLGVAERLRGALGLPVRLRLPAGLTVAGELRRVGPDWLLLGDGDARETIVALPAVLGVRGLARFSAAPGTAGVVESRLTLRHALRGVARDRSAVRVHLVDGATVDATVDRVGADFVEVATHAAGEPRRRGDVRDSELVPLAALAAVRRSADAVTT